MSTKKRIKWHLLAEPGDATPMRGHCFPILQFFTEMRTPMPINAAEFKRVMARVPGAVTVATTVSPSGKRWGFTASSFSSLSIDPPLILICLHKSASTYEAFASANKFMINVLTKEQSDVALRFARPGMDRFEAGDAEPCELGLPGIQSASVRLACTMHDLFDGGDHSILVGRVEATYISTQAPLVYCDRSFTTLVPVNQFTGA